MNTLSLPIVIASCLLLGAGANLIEGAQVQKKEVPQEQNQLPPNMTVFQFVLLNTGKSISKRSEEETQRLQREHLGFLSGLMSTGKAILVGPVSNGGDIRGIVILTAKSVDEAKSWMKDDPWVSRGVLDVEVHSWMAMKDIVGKPAGKIDDIEPCWLGILKRPANAPSFSADELTKLQAGHMANINAMANAGVLFWAGPFLDDGTMRGLFFFRGRPEAEIKNLIANDPMIKAGRLANTLFQMYVSKGVIPPVKKD